MQDLFTQNKNKPEGRCGCCDVTVANDQYYPDRAAQREVNAIVVLCRYKQLDCPWEGQLLHYRTHVRM